MERMEFIVYSTGSSTGFAVLMKISIPGRSELPSGRSYCCFRAATFGMLLRGLSLGSWLRSHENPNHTSSATDNTQSHLMLEMLFRNSSQQGPAAAAALHVRRFQRLWLIDVHPVLVLLLGRWSHHGVAVDAAIDNGRRQHGAAAITIHEQRLGEARVAVLATSTGDRCRAYGRARGAVALPATSITMSVPDRTCGYMLARRPHARTCGRSRQRTVHRRWCGIRRAALRRHACWVDSCGNMLSRVNVREQPRPSSWKMLSCS
ncbi:hypothetical protein PR202_ga29611 [Eleusine coracana subsp. coracana]|uniref:Uncharacterized protein n=1 Tax=Eleusine coracana subsp. coracana TaxID=191504 RepID=A0AAV5DLP0_ELECO|nr:hypothetical protein PR202_ga29611 [Eleusine coracana subsp. coracana]